jgi:CheY-like chemotaxis protein
VDPHQVRQVIGNIVTNSREAMREGGVLEVEAENVVLDEEAERLGGVPGPHVRISFRDEGPGIPPEDLDRLFDPYYSTKTLGTQKGMGLGLAVAHAVVDKHGGFIEVESAPGEGARFAVCLPAPEGVVVDEPSPPEGSPAPSARILFMDDEEAVRGAAETMLEHLGYEVCSARDGEEAIRVFRESAEAGRPFAAVVLDLTVPGGMGGREALGALRRIDPDVRAIVSSGYSEDPSLTDPEEHGFRGVLPKPYVMAQLSEALAEVLGETPS